MSSSVGGGGGGGAGGGGGGGGADIASLLDKAKELDQLRKEQDEVVTEINKMHKKILSCFPPYMPQEQRMEVCKNGIFYRRVVG
ncbi:hypothetical protein OsI_38037 [Oryza sativa Indica Group]|uniref:Uncharacterized protein n=1 Tax=Oryza sativa subsp. indica TaxID=39946 RepID=B8BP71_ORYSI|nr:hypothetical protein OsI_38037 [Oryza sativa Indica Group]